MNPPVGVIKLVHDFNDRQIDGNYRVWIKPGTAVVMFDGDGTVLTGRVDIGAFILVEPQSGGTT